MDHPLISLIATLGATFVVAVGQITELSVVMSFAGLGGLIGQTVAARRVRRRPDAPTLQYVVRWMWVGACVGVLVVVVDTIIG